MTDIKPPEKEPPEKKWERMSFKGNKVWVAFTPDGQLLENKDKVLIKYNLTQNYEYWIKKERLEPLDQAVPAGEKKATPSSGKSSKQGNEKIPKDCIHIYTDGASSGNPGPAGIGALLIYNENRKQISQSIGIATNNVAELSAIKIAISHLKRHDLPVRIFSDSSYAIGVLTKARTPQANKELVLEIKRLIQKFRELKFIKVKGHAGIKENEVADFLATSAIKAINKGL
jgi:ribonuclease HI